MVLSIADQSIAGLTAECERRFDLCSPRDDVMEHDWVVNRRVDFSLWIDMMGASAAGRASLDARLESRPREAALTKSMLSRFLNYLDRLEKATSASAFGDAKRDVDSVIENLTILAVAIRSTGRVSRFRKADARLDRAVVHEFEQYLEFMVLISPFLEDNLRDPELRQLHKDKPLWWGEAIKGRLSILQQRLIEANVVRRNRFIYAQRHSRKLAVRSKFPPLLVDQQVKNAELSLEQEANVIEGRETMVNPQDVTMESPFKNILQKAPALSATSASALEQSNIIARFQRKQKVPMANSQITSIAGTMEYPKLSYPAQAPSHLSPLMAEKCPCCCEPLPEDVFQSHREWEYAHLTYILGILCSQVNRKHLVQDVQPYTCFAENCPTPTVLYATTRDLEIHLQQQHKNRRICQLCDFSQARNFEDLEKLIQHVQEQHEDTFPQELYDDIELWPTTLWYGLSSCPLCHSSGPTDDPILIEHVLKHIHWFSLLSLPWSDSQIQICTDFVPEYTDHGAMQKCLGELELPTEAQLDRAQTAVVAPGISHMNTELLVSSGYFSNTSYFAVSATGRGSRPATPDTILGEGFSASSRETNRSEFIVPYPRSFAFKKQGRALDLLGRLKIPGAKSSSGQKQLMACLHGLSDITNTYTVLEFAYAIHDSYPEMNIFWLRGDSMDAFSKSLSRIALKCNILGATVDLDTDALSLMRSWLGDESHGRWVVIIDSCNENLIQCMVEQLPECVHGAIIFTTRQAYQLNRPNSDHDTIYVEAIQSGTIAELLRNTLLTRPHDEKTLQSVLVHLGRDHLRLSFILAFIRTYKMSADDFFLLIGDRHSLSSDLLVKGMTFLLNDVHLCESLEETWGNSLARIRQSRASACHLLSLLSVLSSTPIPYSLFQAYMKKEHKVDEADFDSDLRFLEKSGLLSITQTTSVSLILHSAIQWAIRKWLASEGKLEEVTKEAIITISEALPSIWGSSGQESIHSRLVPHAVAVLDHSRAQCGLGPMPQQASLYFSLAHYLFEEGELNDAARYCQEALDMNEYIWGSDHPSTVHISTKLAKIREIQEDLHKLTESKTKRQPRTPSEPIKEVRISRKSMDKKVHLPAEHPGSIFDQVREQETRSERTSRGTKRWSGWVYDGSTYRYYRYRKTSHGLLMFLPATIKNQTGPNYTISQSKGWEQSQERGDIRLECSDDEVQQDATEAYAGVDYSENGPASTFPSRGAIEDANSSPSMGKGKGKVVYEPHLDPYSSQTSPVIPFEAQHRYRVEPSARFQPGEIFKVLWAPPQLEAGTSSSMICENGRDSFERPLAWWVGFRRFVVVTSQDGHSRCVPIYTYGGMGCTKRGTRAASHGIIFAHRRPRLIQGEPKLGFRPVKAHMVEEGETLSRGSRIKYSALTTVEHKVSVLSIGRIASDADRKFFSEAVNSCWVKKNHKENQHEEEEEEGI
ncbi:hypothetical protein S7711_01597 [Stachybotrys chartarum IBT 7711]|uniref:DUF6590 domain-containing protein n=1 Tax=Stachybotrys chartarum (strain CBS 109288 / IBT 7711) TaxID=1280523 RepID=A0A084BC68_STACB|nr:hypothetical protein S7711_01597 [Stachybotrys chartarum IBT 7711]